MHPHPIQCNPLASAASVFLTIFVFQFFIMCSAAFVAAQPPASKLFMHNAGGRGSIMPRPRPTRAHTRRKRAAKCKIPIGFMECNSRCRLTLGNRSILIDYVGPKPVAWAGAVAEGVSSPVVKG